MRFVQSFSVLLIKFCDLTYIRSQKTDQRSSNPTIQIIIDRFKQLQQSKKALNDSFKTENDKKKALQDLDNEEMAGILDVMQTIKEKHVMPPDYKTKIIAERKTAYDKIKDPIKDINQSKLFEKINSESESFWLYLFENFPKISESNPQEADSLIKNIRKLCDQLKLFI